MGDWNVEIYDPVTHLNVGLSCVVSEDLWTYYNFIVMGKDRPRIGSRRMMLDQNRKIDIGESE
jgi:hypothetical protein